MGKIKEHPPVKLITGMITGSGVALSRQDLFDSAQNRLSEKFGEIDFESSVLPFDYTNYYEAEIGKNLLRKFVSFENLIQPDELAEVKVFTNELETQCFFPDTTNRQINLDPGYVAAGKMILATTKDHAHRIYLSKGIFAEITLRYYQKTFQPWEWTYQDYRTEEYITIFNRIRQIYMKQLKEEGFSAHPIVIED